MASETDEPDEAAERLEAALERIAQAATRAVPQPGSEHGGVPSEEIAARLDNLIDRLRAALGGKAD